MAKTFLAATKNCAADVPSLPEGSQIVKPSFAKAEKLPTASRPHSHRTGGEAPLPKSVKAGDLRNRLLKMIVENEQQRRSDLAPRQPTPK